MRICSSNFFLWLALTVSISLTAAAQDARDASLPELRAALQSGDRPVKIVCFGDSVTGLYYHTGGQRTYTNMLGIALRQIYPKADVTTTNAGISGHTTANGLARIEKDVLARRPDLVTVMFGLNDMTRVPIETYRDNLVKIVDQCRGAGAEVILCTPNAVITTPARPVEKLIDYCEVVREVARKHQVPLCDSFAAFDKMRKRDPDAWRLTLSDEIHPNMAGHKGIAVQIARTVTGQSTSLAGVGPPQPAIDRTLALVKDEKPVRILAMPPFDSMISDAINAVNPGAQLDVVTWPVDGLTLAQLEKDASRRVRKMKPNLVLVAIPRSAKAESREQFVRSQHWTVNYALSFGKKEWDTVVIHPSVAEPDLPDPENDELIRKLTAAHDLSLIDRAPGDSRGAAAILSDWVRSQRSAAGQ